ncbi:hypothetical protein KCU75_g24061, partial [Aureobasidium melanogenum]
VASELRKMTAFIRQEALEKAREIHLKADDDAQLDNGVRQVTAPASTSLQDAPDGQFPSTDSRILRVQLVPSPYTTHLHTTAAAMSQIHAMSDDQVSPPV